MSSEETVLVCTRIADGPSVPGVTGRCATCDAVVSISPATFEMWTAQPDPKRLVCAYCWLHEIKDAESPIHVQGATAGQVQEIRDWLKRRRAE